jgi:hypothetical protein
MNIAPAFDDHWIVNDTDRTILSLLWHENAADVLDVLPRKDAVVAYEAVMKVLGAADYLDRLTFQRQIWQLGEMTSLLKTFQATQVLRRHTSKKVGEVRFTKVLTKFSSEHNNKVFLQRISQHLGMEKRDILLAFERAKGKPLAEVCSMFEMSTVDVNRMFRFVESISK